MKATIELVNAMRAAADEIESKPDLYRHSVFSQCNVGILAKRATNVDANRFDEDIFFEDFIAGNWQQLALHEFKNNVCSSTGIPLDQVFATLYQIGMTSPLDYEIIENAAQTAEDAIAYFRCKADELEQQLSS